MYISAVPNTKHVEIGKNWVHLLARGNIRLARIQEEYTDSCRRVRCCDRAPQQEASENSQANRLWFFFERTTEMERVRWRLHADG